MENTFRSKLIDVMMNNMADVIKVQNKLQTEMMPLNAIWLHDPIRTSREVKKRITTNDLVKIESGILVDCDGPPTHKIIALHGTCYDTRHSITVEGIEDKKVETIIL